MQCWTANIHLSNSLNPQDMSSVYIFTTRYFGENTHLFSKDNSIMHTVGESDPLIDFYIDVRNYDVILDWIQHIAQNDAAITASVLKVLHQFESELTLEEVDERDLKKVPDFYNYLVTDFGEYIYRFRYQKLCSSESNVCLRYRSLKSADNLYCLPPLPDLKNENPEDDRKWVSALVGKFASSDDVTDVYLVLHDKDLSFTKTQPYMVLENDAVPYPCGCVKRIHVVVFQHSANAVIDILKDASCQDVGSCVRRLHAEKALIKAREKAAKCWRNAENMKQLTEEMAQDRHLQEFYPGLTAEGLLEM